MRFRFVVALLALPLAAQQPVASLTTAQLVEQLRDSSAGIRVAARAELRRRGAPVLRELDAMLQNEKDMQQMHKAAYALVQIGSPALPVIRQALADTGFTAYTVADALQWSAATDSEAIPLLLPLLADSSARVRTAAVTALNTYREGSGQVGNLLVRMLGDPSADVRAEAASQLIQLRDTTTRRLGALALVRMVDDPDRDVRRSAVYALGSMGDVAGPGIPAIARRISRDPDAEIRWLAARVLGWLGPQASDIVPLLLQSLHHRDGKVREESMLSLGEIGVSRLATPLRDSVLTALRVRLSSPLRNIRHAAATALAATGAPAIPNLVLASRSADSIVAVIAVIALGTYPESSAVDEPLLAGLRDHRREVREHAAHGLGAIGPRVDARLHALVQSRDTATARWAARALRIHDLGSAIPVANRCYAVRYGAWSPPLPSGTIEGTMPPRAVRFSMVAAQWSRRDSIAFTVEQPFDGRWYPTGYWVPDSLKREIAFDPSPSLSGVRATVHLDGAGMLVGTMTTYWDFTRDTATVSITGRSGDCSELVAASRR
jgi:HEAT repeat protein